MNNIANILSKDLKKCLEKDVFKRIAVSPTEFPFLSDSTKKSMENYMQKKDLKSSKKLWKNLLMDSICILKVNDARESMYSTAKKNKKLFIDNFDSIRKTSSYGINEIDKYFDDFIEFESVLYGTDKHYRDHVDHVLNVWAIGISLISHNGLTFNDGYIIDTKHDFHFEIRKNKKKQFISKSELWAMWTIISLCHDLGYPIEKTSKVNSQAKKIISHFGNMNFSELNYSFDIFNTFLVDKFLNVISSKALIDKLETTVQTKFRDKISKSLEDYKHGVFSSLLIFKSFTYFLETDFSIVGRELSAEDLRQFHIRKEILRAIAGHTCPKIYHIELNTLSFLLILCDELQEWDRPKFDDFRNRSINEEPKVILKEFNMGVVQKISIQFTYEMDFPETQRNHLVYSKFKNIHNLLRSAKDDSIRKIDFIWEILFIDKKFILNFNSSNNAFELMNIFEYKKTKKNNLWAKREKLEIYDSN